jgi:O-methyltransferase involved in polyketide biosynthesis
LDRSSTLIAFLDGRRGQGYSGAVHARDLSTISPSAYSLLVMRAQNGLPFARTAAELLPGPDGVATQIAQLSAIAGAELRRRHFEDHYRGIDVLLAEAGATRVLELASGLSFGGLALAVREAVVYVDTDLSAMAETKAQLVAALDAGSLVGELRVRALDALGPAAFRAVVAELPPGPVAIVNEGLLMYLDPEEKRRLADNPARPGRPADRPRYESLQARHEPTRLAWR